jgi:archaellum biogenesis protein FlaJ (TadC family)
MLGNVLYKYLVIIIIFVIEFLLVYLNFHGLHSLDFSKKTKVKTYTKVRDFTQISLKFGLNVQIEGPTQIWDLFVDDGSLC